MTDKIKAGGIIHHHKLWLVGVMAAPDRPGLAAAIFRALGQAGLNAQFIVQSIDLNHDSHVQFCVAEEDGDRAMAALGPVAEAVGAKKVTCGGPAAMLAVFGPDFRERPGIAGLAFEALAQANVNILAISTSISTVTCVIAESDAARGIEALRGVFDLP